MNKTNEKEWMKTLCKCNFGPQIIVRLDQKKIMLYIVLKKLRRNKK